MNPRLSIACGYFTSSSILNSDVPYFIDSTMYSLFTLTSLRLVFILQSVACHNLIDMVFLNGVCRVGQK